MGAGVRALTADELAGIGLDAELLAACRRRRGQSFDGRIAQLVAARLLQPVAWSHARVDELLEICVDRPVGRSILAAAFGPMARAELEVYWDAINEYAGGGRRFWLYDFLEAFVRLAS